MMCLSCPAALRNIYRISHHTLYPLLPPSGGQSIQPSPTKAQQKPNHKERLTQRKQFYYTIAVQRHILTDMLY